jgi:hypothetical protein
MNANRATHLAVVLAWFAGAADFMTGLGLVLRPALVLQLMGASPVPAETQVFLRFVGAFVGAVGLTYLIAAWRRERAQLKSVLELTIVFRLAAGGFAATAIGLGWLESAWTSVPATDLTLAALQGWLLAKGAGREG